MNMPDARNSAPAARTRLVSFDGGVSGEQDVIRPDRYRHLTSLSAPAVIARGGGYSYAAASFGSDAAVADMRAFSRILGFDPTTGILECEGGATLRTVYDVATPAGWHLPVQPGYPSITIGGCIAADVHGKNQYDDGTFRRHVLSLRIFHPSKGEVTASPQENPELFDLTCGGFGLTGIIVSATIRLKRLPGASLLMKRIPVRALADVVPILERVASDSDLLYTWHNFTAKGLRFGEGYVYTARFQKGVNASANGRIRTIDANSRSRYRLQFLNRSTTPSFNRLYDRLQRFSPTNSEVSTFQALFPVANKVVFFELFGTKGFHEYQVVLPTAAFLPFCDDVRRYVERDRTPIALASCKLFRGDQSLLRFDGSGVCMALDFPRDRRSTAFADFLDGLVIRYGAIPNISKDSRLPRDVVRRTYVQYESFRSYLRRWDPGRIYRSELSSRLDL